MAEMEFYMSVSFKNKDRLFDPNVRTLFVIALLKESFMCLSDDSFETNHNYSKKNKFLTGKHVKTLQTFFKL